MCIDCRQIIFSIRNLIICGFGICRSPGAKPWEFGGTIALFFSLSTLLLLMVCSSAFYCLSGSLYKAPCTLVQGWPQAPFQLPSTKTAVVFSNSLMHGILHILLYIKSVTSAELFTLSACVLPGRSLPHCTGREMETVLCFLRVMFLLLHKWALGWGDSPWYSQLAPPGEKLPC